MIMEIRLCTPGGLKFAILPSRILAYEYDSSTISCASTRRHLPFREIFIACNNFSRIALLSFAIERDSHMLGARPLKEANSKAERTADFLHVR